MSDFQTVLLSHAQKYPKLTPQDAVKLCYQSAYGPGHMIASEGAALSYLQSESDQTPKSDAPLFEKIGGGLCRAYLSGWTLPLPLLNRAFILAANSSRAGSLEDRLTVLWAQAQRGVLPFTADALSAYLNAYRAQGCPAVHHSDSYRAAYKPAYRVVDETLMLLYPAISRICALLLAGKPFSVAIDGRCGSGKTTLSGYLHALFDCPVVSMDDFFLPFEQKTPQRLALPGGNADHERFAKEVLPHLNTGNAFAYTRYDCQSGSFLAEPVRIPEAPFVLIEGSYCCCPPADERYTLKLFVTVSPETQRQRLIARDEARYPSFESRWIPMEEQYFKAFDTQNRSDIVIVNEDGSHK